MTWVPAVRVRPTPPAVAHRDQAAVVGLKSVDSRESLLGRIVTRDCDAGLAESLPVLREPLPEGDEDDHFLSSCKHVLYALLDGFVLGLVERRRSLADMLMSKYEWPSQKKSGRPPCRATSVFEQGTRYIRRPLWRSRSLVCCSDPTPKRASVDAKIGADFFGGPETNRCIGITVYYRQARELPLVAFESVLLEA